jgi:acyl-coenzyme A synthetase/AMP-(fatty) acid ligase
MSNLTAPLIIREAQAVLAWIDSSKSSPPITARRFLSHVRMLSERLPDDIYGINLCDDRYYFLVALCAQILREKTNLLPSNKNVATQLRLSERYEGSFIIHDGSVELADNMEQVDLSKIEWLNVDCEEFDIPEIRLDHVSVISFTSGSTGEAKPNIKTWRTLVESTKINSRYMLPKCDKTIFHLATVPAQHMWGLETSVLMALFSNVCLVNARPLFPADIIELLETLPQPRTLITTPIHLRSINALTKPLPKLANLLVATAPLDQQLAKNVESKFNVELREVYGCSEVGSMAIRRTANTDTWKRFDALQFSIEKNSVSVSAKHLPEPIVLSDSITMLDEHHFKLQGRCSDQVDIAGKRGSLSEMNKVLLSFPGLLDGVVFMPHQKSVVPRLVALVVLAQGVSRNDLKLHFRKYLDVVFVPRPIIRIESLPREENGKLIQAKLLEFYQTLKIT